MSRPEAKRPLGPESQGGGKAKKSKYAPGSIKTMYALPIGHQGILITIDGHGDPRKASREALAVLCEVYELLDPGNTAVAHADEEEEDNDDEEEGATDFSSLLASETTELKNEKKHRFRFYDTGLKNCMFLQMHVDEGKPGPKEVVDHLLRDAMKTKKLQFRFCARFIPCTHIFKASQDSLEDNAAKVIPELIDCSADATPTTVAVLYEHRMASGLDRNSVIDTFIGPVPRPPHSVNLKGAKKTISVQVVRNACAVSVIDDYHELQRCNIRSICEPPPKGGMDAGKKDGRKSSQGKVNASASKAEVAQGQARTDEHQVDKKAVKVNAEAKTDTGDKVVKEEAAAS